MPFPTSLSGSRGTTSVLSCLLECLLANRTQLTHCIYLKMKEDANPTVIFLSVLNTQSMNSVKIPQIFEKAGKIVSFLR